MATRNIGSLREARRNKRLASLACSVLLLGAVTLAACGGDDSSSNSKSNATTTTTTNNRNFAVTLPDGQASVSLGGQLPPGWPSGFPLPSGTKAAGSGSMGNGSTTTMVGVFSSSSAPKDVYDFYANNSSLQTSEKSSIGVGSSFAGSMKFAGSYTGSLAVVGRDNKTYIVVELKSSTSGSTTTT